MTPEESIARAVENAGLPCGHWPYTRSANVFAGWRPARDAFDRVSGRRMRTSVRYDLVLCFKRGMEDEAERKRFALYDALNRAGWALEDAGPEAYMEATEMFYWPVTVTRSFGLDAYGQPYDLTEKRDIDGKEDA